ncbi:cell division protein FtsX [Rubrobacter indicoceani]|uniref:cell division protein FtsX n=1 Tax=Rubrobacter indicoceani TaxID=2051957 RepID=UPI000E5AE85E|nr:permease-like cell division protein FtsX [Rubrobacter indicoceani]
MRFNLGFFVKEAFGNLRRNILMALTAITTTFICILVLGMGLLVGSHVEGVIGSVRQDVNIEWYLPNDVAGDRVTELEEQVGELPEVAGVRFISEEQAMERFQATFRDNPEIYEDVNEGILPPSLEIQLEDPAAAEAVAGELEGLGANTQDLNYPQQTIERLTDVTRYITWGLYGATVLFLIASVLLISNAIRLSIFARRGEIEVMKLVGASDGFVRTPFLFEGLLQSLVGAGLAALLVAWLNSLFVGWSQAQLPYVPISGGAVDTVSILLILVAVGVAIGVVGSFVSVARFLKV